NKSPDSRNSGAPGARRAPWRWPPPAVSTDAMPMDAKTFKTLFKPVQESTAQAPPELCDLIHQCLEFQPNKRPERMSEIQGTLDHLVAMAVTAPESRLEAMEGGWF